MSSNSHLSVGTIGAGLVAQTIAGAAIEAGHQVTLGNSRGPDSLKDLVSEFGDRASAGTTAEAAQADIVILAVRWAQVPDAVKGVPDWDGRIVIDATNQSLTGADEVDLGEQTGSERNAALMPGALVVKAFNTVSATIVAKTSTEATVRSSSSLPATTPTSKPPSQPSSNRSVSHRSTLAALPTDVSCNGIVP